MLKFFKQEHLTDVTFLCNDSKPVHAHRKVLVQISPLLRKIVNSRPKEERLMIVVDDFTPEDIEKFLSLVYKGEARHLSNNEIKSVNALCSMLGADIDAVKLDKNVPKESSIRKTTVKLGGKENITNIATSGSPLAPDDLVVRKRNANSTSSTSGKVTSYRSANSKTVSASSSPKTISDKKSTFNVPIYCLCREPERPGMIGCDYCDEWYHISCLNLSKDEVKELTKCKWTCPKCELKDSKLAKESLTTLVSSSNDTKPPEVNEESEGRSSRSAQRNKRKGSTLSTDSSSSDSSSSSSSSSSSTSSNSSSSTKSSLQEKIPVTKKLKSSSPPPKTAAAVSNGSSNSNKTKSKSGSEDLFFCYICKSIFISQSAKEKHEKEKH